MPFFSFLSTFYTHSTFNEKKFIITISIMYGLLAPSLMGLAFWFKFPYFDCVDKVTSEQIFHCSKELACNGDYIVSISNDSFPSVASHLGLICDRESIKTSILKSYFLGGIFGCLSNIILPIPSNKRKMAIVFVGLIQSAANFSIIFNVNNIHYLQLSFAMLAFSLMILHPNCPLILNESFVGNLAKASISIMLMCWGLMAFIFTMFSYMVNADFVMSFGLMGVLHMTACIYLFLQDDLDVHEHFVQKVYKYINN